MRAQVEEAQRTAQRAQQMQAQIQALRASARSRDGDVTVTVDASGALTDLSLTDAALDQDARALAASIVATAATARRLAGERALAAAEEALGAGTAGVEHLRAEIAQREAARASNGLQR